MLFIYTIYYSYLLYKISNMTDYISRYFSRGKNHTCIDILEIIVIDALPFYRVISARFSVYTHCKYTYRLAAGKFHFPAFRQNHTINAARRKREREYYVEAR